MEYASGYSSRGSTSLLDSMAMEKMGKSQDIKEGIASFLEKREPDFPMKVSKDLPDLTAAMKPR